MEEERRAIKLNIYKLNDKVKTFDDFIFSSKAPQYILENEKLSGSFQYKIFIQRDKPSTPQWVELLGNALQKSVQNTSASFVMIAKKQKSGKDYFFALTGGHTSYGIVRRYIEDEFGLAIAEKSLDPKKIKNISQTTFTGSDKQIFRAVKAYNPAHDIENQRRILKSLQGKTVNPELVGFSLSGSDSLAVKKPMTLNELDAYFDVLIQLYDSTDPRTIKLQKTFHVIKEQNLIDELREKLAKNLGELIASDGRDHADAFFIGYKDYFDFLRCDKFSLGLAEKRRTEVGGDLEVEAVVNFFKKFGLDPKYDLLGRITVRATGDDGEEILDDISLLYFLYAEIEHNDKTYFHIDHKWYELDPSYKKYIDLAVRELQVKKGELPDFSQGSHKDEGTYNTWVPSQIPEVVCLDRQLTSYKVEICDLYHKTKNTFYHLKRAWGAKMSHLFAQGLVSAQLYATDPDYRNECNGKETSIDKTFQQSKYRVVFGIIDEKADRPNFPENMTYFSKVNLLDTASRIRALGFIVELSPVKVTT